MKYEKDNDKHVMLDEVNVTAKGNPVKLDMPKYEEFLPVGVEFIADGDMEDLQNNIGIPQKEGSAVLPEVKNSAKGGMDNPYELPEVEVVAKRNNGMANSRGSQENARVNAGGATMTENEGVAHAQVETAEPAGGMMNARVNPQQKQKADYSGELPKEIAYRDIKPVEVKDLAEEPEKQKRKSLKEVMDSAKKFRREMTPEERAKWERSAAIIGDIARLGAQSYAIGNGAWKVEKAEPETKKANERRRELQEREYARMAQQAKERRERLKEQAKEAREQERWQKKYDADLAHQQWEKEKYGKEQEQKQQELEFKKTQQAENAALKREELKKKAKTALETEVITVNGKTYSKEKDGANYLVKAYVEAGRPEITRRVQKKNDVGGYEYNPDESPIYLDVPVSNPTESEIAMALYGMNGQQKQAGFKNGKSAGFSK